MLCYIWSTTRGEHISQCGTCLWHRKNKLHSHNIAKNNQMKRLIRPHATSIEIHIFQWFFNIKSSSRSITHSKTRWYSNEVFMRLSICKWFMHATACFLFWLHITELSHNATLLWYITARWRASPLKYFNKCNSWTSFMRRKRLYDNRLHMQILENFQKKTKVVK